jgi:TetR/AcrR family transcriptional regulator, transcriptional repressor for nem operon
MAQRSMREEISVAALEQFHARGYSAAGVRDITDAAGAPKGSFYNHFDSKEAMAVEALRRYGTTVGLAELSDESVPPLDRLRAHFTMLGDRIVDGGYSRGCLFGNFGAEIADHSGPIRTAIDGAFGQWAKAITAAIAQAQREGTIAATLDAETTARFILNAWEGTLISARVERSSAAFDAFFRTVFDALLASA